jgi:hypothetical protein
LLSLKRTTSTPTSTSTSTPIRSTTYI